LNLDETWNSGCWLHLESDPTHECEAEVHTRNLLIQI
jgi:hypothetical protein